MKDRREPDIGGDKMAERFLWAGEFLNEFLKKFNKTLTDFEFAQIAAKLGETMFVRSEMSRA